MTCLCTKESIKNIIYESDNFIVGEFSGKFECFAYHVNEDHEYSWLMLNASVVPIGIITLIQEMAGKLQE